MALPSLFKSILCNSEGRHRAPAAVICQALRADRRVHDDLALLVAAERGLEGGALVELVQPVRDAVLVRLRAMLNDTRVLL